MSTETERYDLRVRILEELKMMSRRGKGMLKTADALMRHFTEFNDREIAEYVRAKEKKIQRTLLESYRREVEDYFEIVKALEIALNEDLIENMKTLENVRQQRVAALEKAFKPLGLMPEADRIFGKTRKEVLGGSK